MTAVPSPNAPRPAEGSLTRQVADMLARIEKNYLNEGSGPGTRFEGMLLEDVLAKAAVHAVTARLRNDLRMWYAEPDIYDKRDLERVISEIESGDPR